MDEFLFKQLLSSNDMLAANDRLGGASRDRTDDLMLAKHALSQLSYGPAQPAENFRHQRKRRTL